MGHGQHRHAARRAARPALGRRRPRHRAPLRQPLARLRRLRTPRDPRQVPHRPPLHQPRPRHHRRPATPGGQRVRRGPRVRPRRLDGPRVQPPRRHATHPAAAVGHVQESRRAIQASAHPASTTSATPTPPCSSRPASRSRSSANASGTRRPGFTMATYQHVIPGMQARSRAHLRRHPRSLRRSTGFYPVEVPVEGNRTRRGPGRRGL